MSALWKFLISVIFNEKKPEEILILAVTGALIVSWLNGNIISPILQLSEGVKQIADGTLDFEIAVPDREDELATLCRNFDDMRQRLKESAEFRMEEESENRTLISNITHDLKTPVTSIKGYAEGLLDGVADTPEKREKYIRTIYNKAVDLDTLINELTSRKRIEMLFFPSLIFLRIS